MPHQKKHDEKPPNGNTPVDDSSRDDEAIESDEQKRRLLELARRMDAMVWSLARNQRPSTGGSDNDK